VLDVQRKTILGRPRLCTETPGSDKFRLSKQERAWQRPVAKLFRDALHRPSGVPFRLIRCTLIRRISSTDG